MLGSRVRAPKGAQNAEVRKNLGVFVIYDHNSIFEDMARKKYELGIAFSGGGAKAAAHCGALQALKEYGVRPDVVSGTSAGSLVAAFFSAGFSPVQMIEMFRELNFFRDIVAPSRPRGGLFDSTPLLELLQEKLPYTDIEELPIPTYIVAADMDHGRPKVFSKGRLAPRLVASCSIPIVFKPMIINGVHYVDGGVFQNLPVPAIRNTCEKVIAFSVRQMEPEPYRDNLVYVAMRAYSMMFMSNIMDASRLADTYIELNTDGCSVYDLSSIETLFRRGYSDACAALEADGYERVMSPEKIEFPPLEVPSVRREPLFRRSLDRIERQLEIQKGRRRDK